MGGFNCTNCKIKVFEVEKNNLGGGGIWILSSSDLGRLLHKIISLFYLLFVTKLAI